MSTTTHGSDDAISHQFLDSSFSSEIQDDISEENNGNKNESFENAFNIVFKNNFFINVEEVIDEKLFCVNFDKLNASSNESTQSKISPLKKIFLVFPSHSQMNQMRPNSFQEKEGDIN